MKTKLTFLILLISIQISYSQIEPEWVARFDGPSISSSNGGRSVAVDNSGNVYVAGNIGVNIATIKYNSSGVILWVRYHAGYRPVIALDDFGSIYVGGIINIDNVDYLIIKYDNEGNEQWVRTYNGPTNEDDELWAIAVDKFGSVFVTGGSEGNDNFETTDIVTIKYNSTGTLVWLNRYDGPGSYWDEGRAIAVDTSGNVYVTGSISFSAAPEEAVTIKYNSAGVREWVKIYSSSGYTGCASIALDAGGNVIVAGLTLPDYLTIKYSPGGAQLWVRTFHGPTTGTSGASAVAVDNSGNIYVTGSSRWTAEPTTDYTTIKYSPEGVEQWVRRYNGKANSGDYARSIGVDFMGNVYVTGESRELTGTPSSTDYTTIKYDTDGNQKWLHSYNGTGNGYDWAYSLAVDDIGNVYVTGSSKGISTMDIVTIKYPKGSDVYKPSLNDKWIAGETDTIKWIETGWLTVNIKCITNFETAIEGELILAEGYPVVNPEFEWDIPDTLLSYKSKIIIENANNTSEKIESDIFRIKPYVLTRLNEDSTYYEYRKDRDQWGFVNDSTNMWPQTWYKQFNYKSFDPFTNNLKYSQTQGDSVFAKIAPTPYAHIDWISWVKTFGIDACYFSAYNGMYKPTALAKWWSKLGLWGGSCFGIAAANALAFSYKEQFQNKYPNYPDFINPITVASDTGVKRVVNELFTHQYGNPSIANDVTGRTKTPNQTLNDIKQMLLEDEVETRTITIFGGDSSGAHTILAYKVRQDQNQKNKYYVDVYDNSNPNSNNPITIDTSANGGNGMWSSPDWAGWNGKIYLEIKSEQYFNGATFSRVLNSQSPFILAESVFEINFPSNSPIKIIDAQGNVTGFQNNIVFNEIPGSFPLIYKNGSVGPPYGYNLPTDNYSVVLNEFEEDTISTFFFTGNKSFMYERSGAVQTETDRLFFDGGVSVSNPDAQSKTVKLLNLINETTQEKLTVLRSIELVQNDSIKIENPDSNKVKLISYGSAKDYDIELNYVSENGLGRFGDFNIQLSANTSHTFVPDWTNISNSQLVVLVDIGNNGTIDDTLYLNNAVDVEDEGSLLVPDKFNLAQNYPNPFNPITTIQYSIPQRSSVTLKIYDVLGSEIATLVNEEQSAGRYEITFNASNLSSGVYFYRIQAGSFKEIKKMILLR